MKQLFLVCVWAIVFGCATERPSSHSFSDQFGVQEITRDTYVVRDRFYHDSNILVARMPDDTVLIASSPFETQGADLLISWIQDSFHPKALVAINPHFHSDGTAGNPSYLAAGAQVWAGDKTLALQKQKAESYRSIEARDFEDRPELKARILKRKIALANHEFRTEDGKTFNLGGERVEVIYPGPAHTLDNVVVYLPARKVLFGGCMIRPKSSLGPTADADISAWPASAKRLEDLKAEYVIAGHAVVGGPELIERTVETAQKANLNPVP